MGKIKVIIAENDEDEQFFMKDGLEGSGYFEVTGFVETGDHLLALLESKEGEADMLLSDLNMPGKNGYDILKELRANSRFSDFPIVITSTSSIKSVVDNCFRLGATNFIQKPETFVEYGEFAKALKNSFEKAKSKI